MYGERDCLPPLSSGDSATIRSSSDTCCTVESSQYSQFDDSLHAAAPAVKQLHRSESLRGDAPLAAGLVSSFGPDVVLMKDRRFRHTLHGLVLRGDGGTDKLLGTGLRGFVGVIVGDVTTNGLPFVSIILREAVTAGNGLEHFIPVTLLSRQYTV